MSSINNNPPLPPAHLQSGPEVAEHVAKNVVPSGPRPASKAEQQLVEQVNEQVVRRPSAGEVERLHSQTGYQKLGKRRRGLDLEGLTEAPIPLPIEEVDETAWDQQSLDEAQEELTMQGVQLKQLAEEVAEEGAQEGTVGVFGRLIKRTFKPTQEGVAKLQALETRQTPPPPGMQDVHNNLDKLFGLKLQGVSQGAAMVATALVVAGLSDAVLPSDDSLEPKALCRGMQKMVDNSNTSVEDARTMSSGISKQLALHRTFMFKR